MSYMQNMKKRTESIIFDKNKPAQRILLSAVDHPDLSILPEGIFGGHSFESLFKRVRKPGNLIPSSQILVNIYPSMC